MESISAPDRGARVQLNGTIPRGGSAGSFGIEMVEIPLRDVWGVAQMDPADVDGRIGGTIEIC